MIIDKEREKELGIGPNTAKQGMTMTGAQAVIASLEAEGVTTMFGYPGGAAIKMFDALYDSKIDHILARHEQGAAHMADGYARATGKPGVCLVTSGPGATNTVTAIATAYMDSVPMVVITGQVPTTLIGTDAFQESDIVGITMPIVKHSYLVQSAEDIPEVFREAFYIAASGRPGPVLIDIPGDVQSNELVFEYPDSVSIPSYRPTYKGNQKQIKQATKLIAQATKPVIYAGGGIIASEACEELRELAELTQIPVVLSLMAKGAMPEDHPLNLGLVGMHGSKFANKALTGSDLIITLGARFSDRVTGNLSAFAKRAKVIHVDIDPAEIGKIKGVDVPIVGNAKGVLAGINAEIKKSDIHPDTAEWLAAIAKGRASWPIYHQGLVEVPGQIVPEVVLKKLSDKLDTHNSIVTTEVGQHQMWAAQVIARDEPRTFLTSGGLGTMGYGFPAAIGAKIAFPEKEVVCIAGDGSFQMNSQEMATAAIRGANVKVLILDNRALGMVRQWQKLFYNSRFSDTLLADNPDFCKLADAYCWKSLRVEKPEELDDAIQTMLDSDEPFLLDVAIPRDQSVFPMVAPGTPLSSVMGALELKEDVAVRTDLPASATASQEGE